MAILPLLILAASSAAQAPSAPPPATTQRQALDHRSGGGRPFISPMGEPFRPERGGSGLADWFHEADRNGDGQLTLEEMQADGDRFFAELDVNHDGEIDPDEIDRYESMVAPEVRGLHFDMAAMEGPAPEAGAGPGGGRHRRGGQSFIRSLDDNQHQGAARYGLLDLPEPITAADSNFNRGVSREEFRQAATQRFLALDLDHHGYLTLGALQNVRPAPPARPNRQVTPGEPPARDDDATSYRPDR